MLSAWRLQAGRSQPIVQVRSGFGLPGLADCGLPHYAGWKQFGLLAQAICFVGKALLLAFKRLVLHGAAPFHLGRRERNLAFSSPIDAETGR